MACVCGRGNEGGPLSLVLPVCASWAASVDISWCISECCVGLSLVICGGFFGCGFIRLGFYRYVGGVDFYSDWS